MGETSWNFPEIIQDPKNVGDLGKDQNLNSVTTTTLKVGTAAALSVDASGNLTTSGTLTGPGAMVKAASVAALSAIANTDTLATPVATLVAGTTLKVGSVVKMVMHGTGTAGAAAAGTLTIRAGTAGTTADASVAAITLPTSAASGTNIPFEIKLQFTVQTLGAAGTAFGTLVMTNGGTTGLATAIANAPITFTSSTLATTTATKLTASYISGNAGNSATFQDVVIEVEP